jgi:hypothetical protein
MTYTRISCQQMVSLSQSSCASPVELTDGRGVREGGGVGAKSYDREKIWSSVNHSILSGGNECCIVSIFSNNNEPANLANMYIVQYSILQQTRFTTDADDISCLLGVIETGVNALS